METLKFLEVSTHYPPHHLGGDAVFVEYLSTALTEMGHEVHVLHSPGAFRIIRKIRNSGPDADSKSITRHGFHSEMAKLNLVRTLMFGTSPRARARFLGVAREIKPDVIHWHNTKGFINTPIDVPKSKSLYTAHDYYAVCPRSNLLRPDFSICAKPHLCQLCHLRLRKPMPLWRMDGRRTLRFPANMTIISPSEFVARRLGNDGLSGIRVLRNFVPDPGPSESHTVDDDDMILYVGMLEAHKGPLSLLDAFQRTHDKHGFKAVIVGDGPLRDMMKEKVRSLGLEDRVTITGFLPRHEVSTLVKRAVLQIIPSEWPENAPLSALEALSVGTPLLGSDFGGLPEILSDEAGCMTYRGGDSHDLSQKLISLWENRDKLRNSRILARRSYESRFTPEIHLRSYMRLINAQPIQQVT